MIAIDPRGRVLEFNSAAERTFGFRAGDVRGRELAEMIIAPESREDHRRALRRCFAGGGWRTVDRRIEMIAQRADGTRLPVELALTLVPGSAEAGLWPDSAEAGPVVYGFVRDISERRRSEEQLAYLAYHDPLTGAANHILVEQGLALAVARARRAEASVGLMFVDLDGFKAVNDRFGHAVGDRLLAVVAARFRAALRETDLLARQGGDEFIVVLADLQDDPAPVAEKVGGKLLGALGQPFEVAGAGVRIGASIGISVYPQDAANTEALMRHADVAMYHSKAAGGGCLTFHRQPDAHSAVTRRSSAATP